MRENNNQHKQTNKAISYGQVGFIAGGTTTGIIFSALAYTGYLSGLSAGLTAAAAIAPVALVTVCTCGGYLIGRRQNNRREARTLHPQAQTTERDEKVEREQIQAQSQSLITEETVNKGDETIKNKPNNSIQAIGFTTFHTTPQNQH